MKTTNTHLQKIFLSLLLYASHSLHCAQEPYFAEASKGEPQETNNNGAVNITTLESGQANYHLAFNFNGTLASTCEEAVEVWNTQTHQRIARLQRNSPGEARPIAFSPDGTILAAGYLTTGDIQLWDTKNYQEIAVLPGRNRNTWTIAFSPDGSKLVSGGDEGIVRLWNMNTFREIQELPSNSQDRTNSTMFSPDRTLIAASSHSGIRLWNASKPHEMVGLLASTYRTKITYNHDNRLFACSKYDTVELFDLTRGTRLPAQIFTAFGNVRSIAISPTEDILAVGSAAVQLWNARTNEYTTLEKNLGMSHSVAFSRDGTLLASAFDDGKIRLWEIKH